MNFSYVNRADHQATRRGAFWRILLIAVVSLALTGCGGSNRSPTKEETGAASRTNEDAGTPLKLALNWYPDSQHGGFYAAQELGHFRAAGLDVEIVPGGPAVPVIQNVALRRADFGVANADQILLARAQNAPIVALFAALQTSPRCVMVHKSSGIQSWSDLKKVTLAMGAGQPFTVYLQKKLPLTDVQVVPYTGSVASFLANERFAQQAYSFSEPYVARQKGAEPVCLLAADLGYNTYTSCLFTHEELIREQPEKVAKIVKAIRQGWHDYLANPQSAHARIQAVNSQMDAASLEFGLETLKPLVLAPGTDAAQIGQMDPERWRQLASQLVEIGLLADGQDPTKAFTTQFLR